MRSEQSWSLLDPKPILLYLQNVDEYIVYWNGIVMTHSMALCVAMEFVGIYATPEMKSVLESNYRKIYYANGFETRAWDQKVESSPVYPYIKRIMHDHVKKVAENRDPKDI
jgi:cobalamin biosynthesis Co2+ chelatase CbiK